MFWLSVSQLMSGIFVSKLTSHRPGMWQQGLCLHQWCKHICPVSWIRVHIAELLLRTAHSMCLCLCLSSGTCSLNKQKIFDLFASARTYICYVEVPSWPSSTLQCSNASESDILQWIIIFLIVASALPLARRRVEHFRSSHWSIAANLWFHYI